MSDMRELEPADDSRELACARVFDLRSRREINPLQPDSFMPEIHASQSRDTDQAPPVVDSIERQLAQMQKMAAQLFPEDEIARKECLVRLLNERLQTLEVMLRDAAGRFLSLAIRDVMP